MTTSVSVSVSAASSEASPRKRRFREQMHQAREDAIVQAVNRLLAEKGFDGMTVDEVAYEVGIAKASLYKHFPSKEHLACAAMVRILDKTWTHLNDLEAELPPLTKLQRVTQWAMRLHLMGEMPLLPSENSSLRAALMAHQPYLDALIRVSDQLGDWIEQAQADGSLRANLPPIVVLYTLFARACDPVLGFMKSSGQFSDEQIVALVLSTCFDGL